MTDDLITYPQLLTKTLKMLLEYVTHSHRKFAVSIKIMSLLSQYSERRCYASRVYGGKHNASSVFLLLSSVCSVDHTLKVTRQG